MPNQFMFPKHSRKLSITYRQRDNDIEKQYKYVCITMHYTNTYPKPKLNPNPTTIQHGIVSKN